MNRLRKSKKKRWSNESKNKRLVVVATIAIAEKLKTHQEESSFSDQDTVVVDDCTRTHVWNSKME